jgi:hypothetical protein
MRDFEMSDSENRRERAKDIIDRAVTAVSIALSISEHDACVIVLQHTANRLGNITTIKRAALIG